MLLEAIDDNHYAFIKGRHILNSILITNECFKDYRRKKQKGMFVKLDLEKVKTKSTGISLIKFRLGKALVLIGDHGFMVASLMPTFLTSHGSFPDIMGFSTK